MEKKNNLWIYFALIGLSFILRIPILNIPLLDVDESQFDQYANVLLAGGLPYVDSVDTKSIGIYYFFAFIFLIFGKNNMFAVHAITAIWVGLTGITIFKITSLFLRRNTALV